MKSYEISVRWWERLLAPSLVGRLERMHAELQRSNEALGEAVQRLNWTRDELRLANRRTLLAAEAGRTRLDAPEPAAQGAPAWVLAENRRLREEVDRLQGELVEAIAARDEALMGVKP